MALTTVKSIEKALTLVDSKKENLRKAFEQLQSHSSLLSSFNFTWPDLDSYFTSVQSELVTNLSTLRALESTQTRKPKPEKRTDSLHTEPVPARPELKSLCEKMDGLGLRNYVIERPKERTAVRVELADAFKHAPDAGSMVIDALEGFWDGKQARLKTGCVVLLEELMTAGVEIGAEVRERARAVAVEWKAKMAALSSGSGGGDGDEEGKEDEGGLERLGYLQLLASYKLLDDGGYDVNELIDYVVLIARYRQAVELCRVLGLESKVSDSSIEQKVTPRGSVLWGNPTPLVPIDSIRQEALHLGIEILFFQWNSDLDKKTEVHVIQRLIGKGKQLLALKFILEFEVTDEFPPVPLLKAYVMDSKKLAQKVRKSGKNSLQSLNEAATKEISALKSVIKYIEEHGLESEYSKDELVKRVEKLEKEKADRKRPATASVPKPKQQVNQPKQNGNKRMRAVDRASAFKRKQPSQPSSVNRAGLLPDHHAAPYLNSSAGPYGTAGPLVPSAQYVGPPADVYGLSGSQMIFHGNHNPSTSNPYPSETHAQPGYHHDRAMAYGAYDPSQYHPVYYPQ
ncbi:hypothetical protein BUALT_Bualt03G0108400 [Buddleja alternifolia]|uniref:FRIGIDA-like protein n=1 Tax=Buddleja alternifolia TaxID=168488 RepID=A0AAV6Y0V3_9LAMI|nr:hypothetical protein BUALT_Bualt03G0108400 [Buddleja alternifolia]